MPSSFFNQISDIVNLIVLTEPKSMLDVGIGFGKYGFLAREYVDVNANTESYGTGKIVIDGVEAFPEYITPLHRLIYDDIHIGDAKEILPKLERRYDLLVMIDVLEHFTYEDGLKILELCGARARNVLISTPSIMEVQGAVFGNDFETHQFQWNKQHLKSLPNAFFLNSPSSIICYFGQDASQVRGRLKPQQMRTWLYTTCPWLRPVLRGIKRTVTRPAAQQHNA